MHDDLLWVALNSKIASNFKKQSTTVLHMVATKTFFSYVKTVVKWQFYKLFDRYYQVGNELKNGQNQNFSILLFTFLSFLDLLRK